MNPKRAVMAGGIYFAIQGTLTTMIFWLFG
jgi:hypothetical protein